MASDHGDDGRPPGNVTTASTIIRTSAWSIIDSVMKLPRSASSRKSEQLRERLQSRQPDFSTAIQPPSFSATPTSTSEPSSYPGLITPDSSIRKYQNFDEPITPQSNSSSIDPSTLFSTSLDDNERILKKQQQLQKQKWLL